MVLANHPLLLLLGFSCFVSVIKAVRVGEYKRVNADLRNTYMTVKTIVMRVKK